MTSEHLSAESKGHRAAKLVRAGTHTVIEAAAQVGCSRHTVYAGLHAFKERAEEWPGVSKTLGEQSAQLVIVGGLSVAQSAAEIGCSRQVVYTSLKAIGASPPNTTDVSQALARGLIQSAPTKIDVAQARERAGLTHRAMAELVGAKSARAWMLYESGDRAMGVDRWALLLLALGEHPNYRLTHRLQSDLAN